MCVCMCIHVYMGHKKLPRPSGKVAFQVCVRRPLRMGVQFLFSFYFVIWASLGSTRAVGGSRWGHIRPLDGGTIPSSDQGFLKQADC